MKTASVLKNIFSGMDYIITSIIGIILILVEWLFSRKAKRETPTNTKVVIPTPPAPQPILIKPKPIVHPPANRFGRSRVYKSCNNRKKTPGRIYRIQIICNKKTNKFKTILHEQ